MKPCLLQIRYCHSVKSVMNLQLPNIKTPVAMAKISVLPKMWTYITIALFLASPALGKPSTRIVGGIEAPPGEFPFIVSIQGPIGANGGNGCGAGILTPNAVITAAHCCEGFRGGERIYAGSQKLSSGGQYYDIQKYIIHENYHGGGEFHFNYDICLFFLKTPIPMTPTAQQLIFPTANYTLADGTPVKMVGWGGDGNPVGPDILKIAPDMEVLSLEHCSSIIGPQFEGKVCADAPLGEGTCFGDSGSPLTYNGIHIGIDSIGYNECGSKYPDVFTNVPYFTDWIIKNLGEDSKNLRFME